MHITSKSWLIIVALALIVGALLFFESPPSSISTESNKATGIPEDYYFSLKAADIDSPIELVRFAASIKPDASGMDIPKRVAYYQWYLKNRGFNVSFAYNDNFRNQGDEHVWLLVKNLQGESMYVDPSSDRMKADSICPTTPEYKAYQKTFKDISELCSHTGGLEKYAWWKTGRGKELFDSSIMLLKKEQL
ncbi:MAG TPA: hypothetical protein VMY43_09780 [Methanothrix sp.]|nr:hypothetical protein [Methanothrix sp.]